MKSLSHSLTHSLTPPYPPTNLSITPPTPHPQALFPDNAYAVDSGGDPLAIPELTFEQFKAFHQAYYHPSNGRVRQALGATVCEWLAECVG